MYTGILNALRIKCQIREFKTFFLRGNIVLKYFGFFEALEFLFNKKKMLTFHM